MEKTIRRQIQELLKTMSELLDDKHFTPESPRWRQSFYCTASALSVQLRKIL